MKATQENINDLNQMAKYDFNTPIDATIIFDDSDDETGKPCKDEIQEEICNNTNIINHDSPQHLDMPTPNAHPGDEGSPDNNIVVEINKDNNEIKIVYNNENPKKRKNGNQEYSMPKAQKLIEVNILQPSLSDRESCCKTTDNVLHNPKVIDLNPPQNTSDHSAKQLLNLVAENIVLIVHAQQKYINLLKKKDIDLNTYNQELRKTKDNLFDLSYNIVLNIIIPNEKRGQFVSNFLHYTIMLANSKLKTYTQHIVPVLFTEMVNWVKQKKQQESQNMILKDLLNTPQNINKICTQNETRRLDECIDTNCNICAKSAANQIQDNFQQQNLQKCSTVQINNDVSQEYRNDQPNQSNHLSNKYTAQTLCRPYDNTEIPMHRWQCRPDCFHNRNVEIQSLNNNIGPNLFHSSNDQSNIRHYVQPPPYASTRHNTDQPRNDYWYHQQQVLPSGQSILLNDNKATKNNNPQNKGNQPSPYYQASYINSLQNYNDLRNERYGNNYMYKTQNSRQSIDTVSLSGGTLHKTSKEYYANSQPTRQDQTNAKSSDKVCYTSVNDNDILHHHNHVKNNGSTPHNYAPIITHVTSLNPNVIYETGPCVICGKITKLKCLGCSKKYYCTTECQAQDWRSHQVMCQTATK